MMCLSHHSILGNVPNVRVYSVFTKCFTLFSRFGSVPLICYIAWVSWGHFGPHLPEIESARKEVADEAVSAVVEDLRLNRGEVGSVVLLHFAGDRSGYFTSQLRSSLELRGTLDLLDRSLSEKTRELLEIREPNIDSQKTAITLVADSEADGLLFGRLLKFESTPNGAELEVEYTLVDVPSGEIIHQGHYLKPPSSSTIMPAEMIESVRRIPWFQRGLGWLIIVLLLPVFTIGFIRAIVSRRSNGANALVLVIYLLADVILAYLLVGVALAGFWSVTFFVLAVVVAFAYNIRIMTFAIQLEE